MNMQKIEDFETKFHETEAISDACHKNKRHYRNSKLMIPKYKLTADWVYRNNTVARRAVHNNEIESDEDDKKKGLAKGKGMASTSTLITKKNNKQSGLEDSDKAKNKKRKSEFEGEKNGSYEEEEESVSLDNIYHSDDVTIAISDDSHDLQ